MSTIRTDYLQSLDASEVAMTLVSDGTVAMHSGQAFPTIPQNVSASGYTLVKSDAGKHLYMAGLVTLPTTTYDVGDVVTVINSGTVTMNVIQGAGTTLRLAGDGTAGNKTIDAYGIGTILCVQSGVFFIGGTGVG